MEKPHQSFEVDDFIVELHTEGRRVWPSNFKRYVTQKLGDGGLAIGGVMKQCNVSQSLVYE